MFIMLVFAPTLRDTTLLGIGLQGKNEKDWEDEVYMKSTLKWYRLAKDNTVVERYMRSVQGQESVRLLFKLRTGSAGLLEGKERCRMLVMRGVCNV